MSPAPDEKSSRPWQSDHPIDEATVARLVAESFPELAGAAVHYLDEGWDSVVYRVDERTVSRAIVRSMSPPDAADSS